MTNEEAAAMLERMKNYFLPTSPMLEERREITALDLAISALSKQSASCEQADKKLFGHGYWLMPGEVFISHNVLNEVLDTIIKSMNTEQRKIDSILAKTAENDEAPPDSDQIADGSKMVDQFRDSTKMTEDVPDIHVGKTDFKPGDKFILELGKERRMFGEFEIKGTDLYVKTDLLEKLTRYEPEEKLDSAQPEPPRAYWIRGKYSWDDYHYNDTSYKCSRCGKVDANIPRYCPGCGAKMEEEIR